MASQVAESQFHPEGQGHPFQLRKPLAKPTAKKCKECSLDIFMHSRAEVAEDDLRIVIDATADNKASVIIEGELSVGGFKSALAESATDNRVVLVNCAGTKLHDFLPNTKKPFDDLRESGRVLDMEWEDSSEFADSHLDGGEKEAVALTALLQALDWVKQQVGEGQRVLVNCAQGKSRSGTMATAYVMASSDISAEEALCRVQKARPLVQPNRGFLRQLHKWEGSIRESWRDKIGNSDANDTIEDKSQT